MCFRLPSAGLHMTAVLYGTFVQADVWLSGTTQQPWYGCTAGLRQHYAGLKQVQAAWQQAERSPASSLRARGSSCGLM